MINPYISYFDGGIIDIYKPYRVTIQKLHSGIVSCEKWKNQITEVRKVLEKYGKDSKEYKAAKRTLPYFMPSGVWNNRVKGEMKLLEPSNLIQIDCDNILPENMEAVRKALVADKHTLLLYTSPSNMGYKGLALYEPTNTPPRSFLGEFYLKLNIKIDNSTLFSTQSCFISFDENAYLNLDAEPFIFKETQQPPKKNGGGLVIDYEPSANANSSHVQSYCRKIIEQSARYVFDAPKGTGGDILKGAAYKCGLYAAYGLSKADAAVALWQAFDKRQTGHDKKEFFRLFDFCFEAGKMEAQTNPPAPIKDRPPVQQK